MIILTTLFLLGLAGVGYLWHRDPYFPPVIMAGIWAIVLVCVQLLALRYDHEFSGLTMGIIASGALLFTAACIVVSPRARGMDRQSLVPVPVQIRFLPRQRGALISLGLAVLILPFYVRKAQELGNAGPTDFWYMNLRIAMGEGDGFGSAAYGMTFANMAVFAFQLRRIVVRSRADRLLFWLSIAVAAVYVALSTGRTFALTLAVFALGPLFALRQIRLSRAVLIVSVIGIAVFAAFAVALQKGISADAGRGVFVTGLTDNIIVYFAGGTVGLDHIVTSGVQDLTPGRNTFRFVYAVLARLGFDVEVADLVQDFITEPIFTNVYSVYQPYFVDYGYLGLLIFMPIIGLVQGLSYESVRNSVVSSNAILFYTILTYPLVMQFFQDQYLSLMPTWLQYAVIWVVVFRIMGGVYLTRKSPGRPRRSRSIDLA